jgi:hypothetical protein
MLLKHHLIDIDGIGCAGPFHPEVTLQELQNYGCFRSQLFLFLNAHESKLSSLQKQKPDDFSSGFAVLAVRTGLEPATLGVTGRYSNQLNYRTSILLRCKIKLIFNYAKYIMKKSGL